ncbi:hypothetical protein A0128_14430 [Leptospira tipperaryensis]|uniref:Uncharacterized protein n=1 Tax=Leptospira tipperaryensis TaxID=2564040 RepID=A0A1D7UZF3_9LEPT|nr:hypothetical protein A0128_14430 [Leptospira tipperaryensis]
MASNSYFRRFSISSGKGAFLKGVGFYLDLPMEEGSHSYLIVNPRRLDRRINRVFEKSGSVASDLHMSKPLEKNYIRKMERTKSDERIEKRFRKERLLLVNRR